MKIDERQFGFMKQRSTIDAISKIKTKILDGFRRKEKTAAIFFDIKKAYDKVNPLTPKVNRVNTFEQVETMGIQGRMIKINRELIGER